MLTHIVIADLYRSMRRATLSTAKPCKTQTSACPTLRHYLPQYGQFAVFQGTRPTILTAPVVQ